VASPLSLFLFYQETVSAIDDFEHMIETSFTKRRSIEKLSVEVIEDNMYTANIREAVENINAGLGIEAYKTIVSGRKVPAYRDLRNILLDQELDGVPSRLRIQSTMNILTWTWQAGKGKVLSWKEPAPLDDE
jgi:hypothetical protein